MHVVSQIDHRSCMVLSRSRVERYFTNGSRWSIWKNIALASLVSGMSTSIVSAVRAWRCSREF